MAIARYKTFSDGQVLTAADMNGVQDMVVTNDQSVGNPRTSSFDMDGQRLILSADGNTSMIASTSNKIDLRLNSQDLFDFDGTIATSVNGLSFISSASGGKPTIRTKGPGATVSLGIYAKGAGTIALNVNGFDAVGILPGAGTPVNGVWLTAGIAGAPPVFSAQGSDTDIDLRLSGKGTGVVRSTPGYAVDGATALTWRSVGSGTSYVIQENTGTPTVPVWTTRAEFQTGTSATFASGSGITVPDPNNQLDNGALQIWQDGATSGDIVSATPTFPDRWRVNSGIAGGHCSVSRQTLNANGFQFLQRAQRVAASSGTTVIEFHQAILSEVASRLAGQQVTFSFFARAGANYSAASSALVSRIFTGTAANEGSAAMIGFFAGPWTGAVSQDQTNTLTTTLQRFSHTVTIAAGALEVGVELRFTPVGTAGAADYFEVTGLMVQLGPTAGTYPHQAFAAELAQCQRFYCKTLPYGTKPAVNLGFAGSISQGRAAGNLEPYQRWQYPVEMWSNPSITRYNPGAAGGATEWRNNGDSASSASAQTLHITAVSAIITNTGTALTNTSSWHLHLSAAAVL